MMRKYLPGMAAAGRWQEPGQINDAEMFIHSFKPLFKQEKSTESKLSNTHRINIIHTITYI